MRDHSKPRTYILSAYLHKRTPSQNHAAHCELSCDLALAGFPFQECEGSYKGEREESYLVTSVGAGPTVSALSTHFGQECYIVVSEHDRGAYVVNCATGYHKHVGHLVHVGDSEPDTDGWTKVGGEYYVCDNVGPFTDLPEGL
jgi:hypothetical protein